MSIPPPWKRRGFSRGAGSPPIAPFAALNADPEVIRHFPATLSRALGDELADAIEAHFEQSGCGLWALEVAHKPFAGFVGLSRATFSAHFTPAVEIGWRLARVEWGKGLATEGATAVLGHAFRALGLSEVVSLTTDENWRSRRVMERLGMRRDPSNDFDHPKLPAGHPLRRHVLYRILSIESAKGSRKPHSRR